MITVFAWELPGLFFFRGKEKRMNNDRKQFLNWRIIK